MVLDHEATDGVPGLISILGVKYTTARAVAEKAVDLAVRRLAVKAKKCQTDTAPVHGGRIRDFKAFLTGALENTPHGIKEGIVEHLAYTYGSNHRRFIDEMIENPGLGECIDSSLPVTAAEVVHAVHHEMAWTLADVIQRRTELGAAGLPSDPVLQKCAKIIGGELGWSPARQKQEIEFVLQLYPIKQTEVVAA
jgi:glycerol-3-phosphate dehydrogenase